MQTEIAGRNKTHTHNTNIFQTLQNLPVCKTVVSMYLEVMSQGIRFQTFK